MKFLTIILALIISFHASASVSEESAAPSNAHCVIVPCRGGHEPQWNMNVTSILNLPGHEAVIKVETPPLICGDLGQSKCLALLDKSMRPLLNNPKVERIVVHASSQGTATTLNYVAQHPEKIAALVLEAVLVSGNSTILNVINQALRPDSPTRLFTKLPGSIYWCPYLAKLMCPFYQPGGVQPILSIASLRTDIPVIMIHATRRSGASLQ